MFDLDELVKDYFELRYEIDNLQYIITIEFNEAGYFVLGYDLP